jgi:SagB-type dehydrogenase family enzyme
MEITVVDEQEVLLDHRKFNPVGAGGGAAPPCRPPLPRRRAMLIRRSPLIISEWRGSDTFVRHLESGLLCNVSTEALAFLDGLAAWREYISPPGSEAAVEKMLSLGLLEASESEDYPGASDDTHDATWAPLGWCTRIYHSQTLDAEYLTGGSERGELAEHIAAQAEPFNPKRYAHAQYSALPTGETIGGVSLEWTFQKRRTTRSFTAEPVTWRQLSTLLYYAFGIQGYQEAGPFGRVPVKTSPAAGARHEAEAYVISSGSAAVAPGIFHYDAENHGTARIAGLPADGIGDLVYHQPACTSAPVMILATAILSRLSQKYRHPRAYRLWMYDIGHVGQTLALTATALGLGVFQTIAFRDTPLARLIDADPHEEFPSYLFSIGYPGTRSCI